MTELITDEEAEIFLHEFVKLQEVDTDSELEFKKFFHSFKLSPPPQKKPEVISVFKADQFYSNFTQLWTLEENQGSNCNVWAVAGLKYDEVRISAVLAWLLDPQGTHGQGTAFLEAFEPLLKQKIKRENLASGGRVYLESLPLGDQKSRVDIEIDGNEFLLFIEVKIYALEGINQLARYLEIADYKSGGRPYAVAFLTPTGRPSDDESLFNHIICFSWKDCATAFNSVFETSDLSSTSFIRLTVTQFCEYISKF